MAQRRRAALECLTRRREEAADALRSARVYKRSMSHKEALDIIVIGRGRHFDPGVVDAFLRCEGSFAEVADKLADHVAERAA